MPEYARETSRDDFRVPGLRTTGVSGHAAFVAGLQAMSTDFDRAVANFTSVIGMLRGSDTQVAAVIAGMIRYADLLREAGESAAWDAIEVTSGVPTTVWVPSRGRLDPGLIVGLEDAEVVEQRRVFGGVAIIPNGRGQEAFVRAWITPDGQAYLKPREEQFDFPETQRLVKEIGLQ